MQKTDFLKVVENHTLEVRKDDGLYRHLVLSNGGSSFYRFDIVTWPGFLAYTGDMGAFVFSRIPDMFAFFREKEINPSYWSEKVVAENVHDGIEKFSVDVFRTRVLNRTRSYLDLEDGQPIPDDVQIEIQPLLDAEDEWECVECMRDFSSELVTFQDFWDSKDTTEYTRAFLFACYALVWAIEQYDARKASQA
jgi:hypothetical protein